MIISISMIIYVNKSFCSHIITIYVFTKLLKFSRNYYSYF